MARRDGVLLAILLLSAGCATTAHRRVPVVPPERGVASYYGREFQGRRTASGERYDGRELTGAHRTLSFGTKVRVTDESSGRSVVVRINDRGPFVRGRVIDLSRAAARSLNLLVRGTALVRVEVLSR